MDKMNKKCPFCSEKIVSSAIKCRYCGEWLNKKLISPGLLPPTSLRGFFSKKKIALIIFVALFILVIKNMFWSTSGTVNISQSQLETASEQSLRKVVEEQYRLINSKNKGDLSRLYQEFYSPEHSAKRGTEEEFINSILDGTTANGVDHREYIIHSIRVDGQKGYVDRTQKFCGNSSCTVINFQGRMTMVYVFFQGKWLMTDTPTFCSRSVPYTNPPEFDRIYSLILQRTSNYKTDYELIKNCVLFKYAGADGEMDGAEGLFSFRQGQSVDKLEILVSPRYKIKDDLITSILVIHELSHAVDYVRGLTYGAPVDCFETEAAAFQNQNWFISILNPEERASINARLIVGGSEELRSIKYSWDGVIDASGTTNEEKSLSFVKSNPFYQKQCANQ